MAELCVDQIGQRRPVGFVADVPGLQPSQLGVGRAGARLRHLGQAQVDRVGEDRGQQQGSCLWPGRPISDARNAE